MQNTQVYTLGYARWTIEQVATTLQDLDGVLVDIRHAPYTSKPGFTKSELDARFRDRYRHLEAFGNVNYKDGPIKLANPERGLKVIRELHRVPILMCGCRSATECHRSTVAARIADQWPVSIHHLQAPNEGSQKHLFDDNGT